VGAYDELVELGVPGEVTLDMLRKVTHGVVRSNSFPPPTSDGWTDEAVDDLILRKFGKEKKNDTNFVLGCFLKATDEVSLGNLLARSMQNFLIDEAKGTERGKLRRRLERLLDEDARFERGTAPSSWALAGSGGAVWQGDVDDLAKAAFTVRGVDITLANWNESGPTPKSTQHALLTVAEAVLRHAAGAVRAEDLARVTQQRFPALRALDPQFVSLDEVPPGMGVSEDADLLAVDIHMTAKAIWQTLSPDERALVPHASKKPTEIAGVLGLPRGQAKAAKEALLERLRVATQDDVQYGEVIAALFALCEDSS
jgi:hypothetical protein